MIKAIKSIKRVSLKRLWSHAELQATRLPDNEDSFGFVNILKISLTKMCICTLLELKLCSSCQILNFIETMQNVWTKQIIHCTPSVIKTQKKQDKIYISS